MLQRLYRPSRFGQLHLRLAGPAKGHGPLAPPVLCLHQTPSNGGDWEALMCHLAHDRWVIAPDMPGYGMSDPPPEPLAIADFVALMRDLVDDLGPAMGIEVQAFDVIGHHTGSVVATQLALDDERVRRLVLCSLPAFDAEMRAQMLAGLDTLFPAPDGSLVLVERLRAFQDAFADTRMSAEQRQVAMAECLRLGARMSWAYRAVFGYDMPAALDRLDREVLVLNARDDLEAVTRTAFVRLRHARLVELTGCGHGFLAFADDEFARLLREHLDLGLRCN
ncbi:alpha/beta fold hydrolase [Novosphingobium sp. YJ-S2-02]|uniref:Alpha/beta fold hydrolase n=1 Tax=Novosphingobium aureum TaxID=2792964 RepID=A0A931MLS3_9SPHN|nr:alpha/beta fold hydrolase [Novosphingobium aureum]MBH0113366.1 alpha/beta fold hydrolase [Novosphingobium aureum]